MEPSSISFFTSAFSYNSGKAASIDDESFTIFIGFSLLFRSLQFFFYFFEWKVGMSTYLKHILKTRPYKLWGFVFRICFQYIFVWEKIDYIFWFLISFFDFDFIGEMRGYFWDIVKHENFLSSCFSFFNELFKH